MNYELFWGWFIILAALGIILFYAPTFGMILTGAAVIAGLIAWFHAVIKG